MLNMTQEKCGVASCADTNTRKEIAKSPTIKIDGKKYEIVCTGDDPRRIVTPERTFVMEPYCDRIGEPLDRRFINFAPIPEGEPVEIRRRAFPEPIPADASPAQFDQLCPPYLNMGSVCLFGTDMGAIRWEVLVAGSREKPAPAVAYYLTDWKEFVHNSQEAEIVARWKEDKHRTRSSTTTTAEQKQNEPDSLRAACFSVAWKSRYRWPVLGIVGLLIVAFIIWGSIPDEGRMKILRLVFGNLFN